MSGTMNKDEIIEGLEQRLHASEAETRKVEAELDTLKADFEAGVLSPESRQKFINAFGLVPGLGLAFTHHLPTVDEVLAVVHAMSEQKQRLFDENHEQAERIQHTDNMLAGAGALFDAMQQAFQRRQDLAAAQQQRVAEQAGDSR